MKQFSCCSPFDNFVVDIFFILCYGRPRKEALTLKKQIILIFALCFALSATAIAHPGKTDATGGHYDHDTGQYHYHHGYEAHQHTGGVCPYDFDDKTGENSGSPSNSPTSNNEHLDKSPPSDTEFIPTPATKEKSFSLGESLTFVFIEIPAFILGTLYVCWIIWVFLKLLLIDPISKHRKEKENARLLEEQRLAEYQQISALYSNKTKNQIAELCGMPPNVYLDENNLPHEKDKSQILDPYTVFWEKNSPIYHSVPSCADSPVVPINITQARHIFACRSCRAPQLDLQWYYDYKDILRLMRKHGIEPVPEPEPEQLP